MTQAVQGGVWPESRAAGRSASGTWSIERQDAPVEDYLRFFPDQAGGRVYEQLLFNLPMNLQCLDGAGRISSVNKQWMDTLGYTMADVSGRHWHELLDPDSRQRLTREVYPRYLQSAVIRQVEIVMHRKDGEPAKMLMSAHGYRGAKGRIERTIVILHEVTARRSAETALQRSEERFRGAFDAAAHGIVLVAPNGRVLAHNPAFKDMSGRSDEELSNFAFDDSIHAEDKADFLAAMRRLIAGEVPSVKMELRYIGGSKSYTWGCTSVSLVRDERGDIDHLVVQIVDTTGRREAEKQLEQAPKMEAVGQLTGRLAHDFNNVLTVIIGNLDLIEIAIKNDDKARGRFREVIEAARQGSELTAQLLSFSRSCESGTSADASSIEAVAAPSDSPEPESSPAAGSGSETPPPFVVAREGSDGKAKSAGVPEGSDPVAGTSAAAAPSRRKGRILVVEDQEGVREVAVGFLTEFGYDVIEAEDGIAALSLLQEHKDIDLMFSDVVMPGGLNGFDVAQAAQQIIPDLLILHTSGYPKGAMVHSEEPRLKDNILMKPYRREELERAIDEAFARRELSRKPAA